MSDDNVTLNTYHLFYLLFENRNVEEKKVKVLRCLEQGADVNAVDGRKNTPLHVAVTKDEIDIVQILLDNGALPGARNQDNKTPLDIARNLHTDSGEQIFQLLKTLVQHLRKIVLEKSSKVNPVPPKAAVQKPTAQPATKAVQNIQSKQAGTSGVCGQLYETKLLTLVLLRILNDKDIEDFRLGTNIRGIGALDDMCLRLKVKDHDKPIMIYLQAKHREDREKGLLTVENVRNDKGDFSLIKYFDSYLRIKESFKPNNSNDMFDGEFYNTETNTIIYTSAKDFFTRKLNKENKLSVKVHDIISTATEDSSSSSSDQQQDGMVFQFDYEDSDLESLTKMTVHHRIKSLGSIFLYFIMAEKDKSEVMMLNEHIARYHYVLSREVIIVSNIHEIQVKTEIKQIRFGSFRPEFFTSPSEYLVCLREIFYKEISSTHCDKTPIEDDTIVNLFQDILQNPNALHISRVIGKLATYNEKAHKLEIKKKFNDETELEKIRHDLSELEVKPDVIREAVWLKLKGITFIKLPPQFGNLDMSFKNKNRLQDVVEKLIPIFTKNKESKIVEINDDTVGKLIQPGLIKTDGGIGSAVGNLLVLDDDTKMFKFDLDKVLPKNSKEFLSLFLLKIDKEELRKYRLKININRFPKYHFDGDHYDKRQAQEFLDKLWFYTNQAQEDGVEFILKKKIAEFYNNEAKDKESVFRIHTDAIFLQSHDKVQKWWMDPTKAPSLYLNPHSQYFKEAKDAIFDSPLLTVLNFMFIRKLQKLEINFNQAAVDSLDLDQMTNRINIKTKTGILTALKISQHFHDANNFTFIEFDYVLSLPSKDYNILIKDLKETKMKYLIIIYEKLKHEGTYEDIYKKLKQVMDAFKGENIIVVSNDALADEMKTFEGDDYVSVFDSNNYLVNLTEDSQKKILEKYSKVVFQGDEIFIKRTIKRTSEN